MRPKNVHHTIIYTHHIIYRISKTLLLCTAYVYYYM